MPSQWPKRMPEERDAPEPTPEALFSPSEIYHENSILRPSDIPLYSWIAHVNSSPEVRSVISRPFTHYRGVPAIPLTREFAHTARPFEEILEQRRSARDFTGESLPLDALSKLLYLGDGIVHTWHTPDGFDWALRTAPSGGGLYPIEMYCIALRVGGLSAGLYFYRPLDHCLERVLEADLTERLAEAVPGQADSIRQACVCVVLSAVMPRIKFKYGERGYRFLMLEAGHIAQNLLLAAEAAELGGVAIGGFLDDPMNALLNFDGVEEAVVYLALIGQKQPDTMFEEG
jgi:SagB-type dehydrogenase family enzyme